MPFVSSPEDAVLKNKLVNLAETEPDKPTVSELASALWRQENTIGSFLAQEEGLPKRVDDRSFNPFDYLTEEEALDDVFVSNAALADTVDEIDALRRQSAKEKADRETIRKGGAMSFVIGAGVAIADPINLIPIGGAVAKTYKAGNSILSAGIITGSISSASSAVTEAALHATQLERTIGESAINVGASFLLGSAIGVGANQLNRYINKSQLEEIERSMNVEPKIARGEDTVFDFQSEKIKAEAEAEGITPEQLSVGAAQVANGQQVSGKTGKFLAKALGFDPLSRTLTSANPETRRIANMLAENPYKMDGPSMTAAESLTKIKDGYYNAALQSHTDAFRAYRKRNKGKGTMKRLQFNEAVSTAIREGRHDIPEVEAAAKAWQKELYDPIKNELIETKLLPEDVDVTTAVNYLNRRWNKNKVAAELPDFVKVVSRWLKDEDLNLFAKAQDARIKIVDATGAERTKLQAIIDKAEFKEAKELEDFDYEDIARQIAQRIMGTPDGKLPYDWKMGEGSKSGGLNGASGLRGPLKSRVFQIPDNMVEKFMDNNIEDLGRMYLRQTAADLELTKKFGDVGMTDAFKEIETWHKTALDNAKTEKERLALVAAYDADIKDLAAMRDRIRGVYGDIDPNNIWVRAGRVSRNLNYLRFMGGIVASSVPDVARIFMAEGVARTFSKGLLPLAKNLKTFKVSAAEAKRYGVGIDALMGGRSQIIADIVDYTQPGTAFERGLQSMTDNFGRINLMDYWTAGVKQLHAVTMQNGVIDDLLKGKIDKRLARLGIDNANAENIARQLKKHAEKVDGVWISNAKNWDSPALYEMWAAAIRKESDRVIVVPGQEKPLFMSSELGKTIFQFRSFMFASTQRMLIGALQGQDHNAMAGVLMLTSIGTMAYAFKQWDAKREISDDPVELIVEGIDRAGVLGSLMEINNTLEKLSSNNFGLRPLLGIERGAARFVSRSMSENLLGPTVGSLLDTSLRVANAGLAEDGWGESDTRALRRLIPYQNLTFIRQGFDTIEEKVGDL
jgi:hypothetical protein